MPKLSYLVVLLVMVILIVGVDVLFLRHDLWLRLVVNIAIAIVFVGIAARLRRS